MTEKFTIGHKLRKEQIIKEIKEILDSNLMTLNFKAKVMGLFHKKVYVSIEMLGVFACQERIVAIESLIKADKWEIYGITDTGIIEAYYPRQQNSQEM